MFYKDIWQKSFQAGDPNYPKLSQTDLRKHPSKFAASCNSLHCLHYTVTTPTLVSTNMYKPSTPSPSISFIHIQHLAGQCETYPNDHPAEYPIQRILGIQISVFWEHTDIPSTIIHSSIIHHPIPSRFLNISHPPLMFFGPLPQL